MLLCTHFQIFYLFIYLLLINYLLLSIYYYRFLTDKTVILCPTNFLVYRQIILIKISLLSGGPSWRLANKLDGVHNGFSA